VIYVIPRCRDYDDINTSSECTCKTVQLVFITLFPFSLLKPKASTRSFQSESDSTRGDGCVNSQFLHSLLTSIMTSQYVQDDFVHHKTGTLWTPRDCRIQRTSPNEESFKEVIKCLTLILTVAKMYPVKTLQREPLTFLVTQLSFFIFPPTRVPHKKQNHFIKRAKKLQDGQWEDL
jgi:hypothetical protein